MSARGHRHRNLFLLSSTRHGVVTRLNSRCIGTTDTNRQPASQASPMTKSTVGAFGFVVASMPRDRLGSSLRSVVATPVLSDRCDSARGLARFRAGPVERWWSAEQQRKIMDGEG